MLRIQRPVPANEPAGLSGVIGRELVGAVLPRWGITGEARAAPLREGPAAS
jgi:hypothetical protein